MAEIISGTNKEFYPLLEKDGGGKGNALEGLLGRG